MHDGKPYYVNHTTRTTTWDRPVAPVPAPAGAEQERQRAAAERQARLQAEQAEQQRVAEAERIQQERIAAEQAEQARIAAEKAEQERIAAENTIVEAPPPNVDGDACADTTDVPGPSAEAAVPAPAPEVLPPAIDQTGAPKFVAMWCVYLCVQKGCSRPATTPQSQHDR